MFSEREKGWVCLWLCKLGKYILNSSHATCPWIFFLFLWQTTPQWSLLWYMALLLNHLSHTLPKQNHKLLQQSLWFEVGWLWRAQTWELWVHIPQWSSFVSVQIYDCLGSHYGTLLRRSQRHLRIIPIYFRHHCGDTGMFVIVSLYYLTIPQWRTMINSNGSLIVWRETGEIQS